jgi:hypothetical protein
VVFLLSWEALIEPMLHSRLIDYLDAVSLCRPTQRDGVFMSASSHQFITLVRGYRPLHMHPSAYGNPSPNQEAARCSHRNAESDNDIGWIGQL